MYYLCELNQNQSKASYWDGSGFTHMVYPDGIEGDVELAINGQYEAIPQPKEVAVAAEPVVEKAAAKKGKSDD